MGKYLNASKGLSNLLLAELFMVCYDLLSLASSLLGGTFIPDWVLPLDVIIMEVLGFIGVYLLSKDAPEVKPAFWLKVIVLVLSVVSAVIIFIKPTIGVTIGTWVSMAAGIIDLIVLYRVLMSSGRLCAECGREDIRKSGKTIWILKVVGIILSVLASILGVAGLSAGLNGAAIAGIVMVVITAVLAIVLAVVELVASIKYISFLNKGYKALGQTA